MSSLNKISAKGQIGALCVSADDGQRLHDSIAKFLRAEQSVQVSFEGVETVISAFLNAAIGQLYGEFADDTIVGHLEITGLEPEDLELLQRVTANAKVYFEHRRSFDSAWKTETNDE